MSAACARYITGICRSSGVLLVALVARVRTPTRVLTVPVVQAVTPQLAHLAARAARESQRRLTVALAVPVATRVPRVPVVSARALVHRDLLAAVPMPVTAARAAQASPL